MTPFQGIPNNTADSWWRDAGMRKGMTQILICYLAVYSLGYDGSLLNGLQALPTWNRDMDQPRGYTLGLIAAAYYIPKIFCAPLIAWFADKYGRKPVILAGAVLMVCGALIGGLATGFAMFVGSRVVLGVGTATSQIAASTLIPELAHPRLRHMCASFLNTTFYIGSIFAAWLTFAMVYFPGQSAWSWKIPNLVQGLGPIFLLAAVFVSESPRWLIKNGQEEKAHAILARFHANGDMDDPLVLHQIAAIKASLELELSSNSAKWIDFVRNPANRRRLAMVVTIALSTQLSGNGVVQYFLVPVLRQVGITAPAQSAGINAGLAVWCYFVSLTGASLVERFGRRTLLLASTGGMLFCFIMITGLSAGYDSTRNPNLGLAMVAFIFLFMGCYSIGLTPVPYLYVPEIFTTSMRAKAMGLYITTINITIAFNSFVNPIALAAIGWRYYFVYIGTLVGFGTIYYFFMRETKGMTVEQAAMVYESESQRDVLAAMERDAAISEALPGKDTDKASLEVVEDVQKK